MISEQIQEIARHNATVAGVLLRGGTVEDCVVVMDKAYRENVKELMRLYSICPRKVKHGDDYRIWRCPDDDIPETVIHNDAAGGPEE